MNIPPSCTLKRENSSGRSINLARSVAVATAFAALVFSLAACGRSRPIKYYQVSLSHENLRGSGRHQRYSDGARFRGLPPLSRRQNGLWF